MAPYSALKHLFTQRFILPRVYRDLLHRVLGPDWAEWDPDTLWLEIANAFGTRPSDPVRDKLNALRIVLTTSNFWNEYLVFEKVVIAFNDRMVDPEYIQVCRPEELAYGLEAAHQVLDKKFSNEVVMYVRGCCEQAGLIAYHRTFRFAEPVYKDPVLAGIVRQAHERWKDDEYKPVTVPVDSEDPVEIQVGKLHDIEVYLRERVDLSKVEAA